MTSVESSLLAYDELAPSDRAIADDYLARHPEAWRLVTQGRLLRQVLAISSPAEIGDDLLAAIVATRTLDDSDLPPHLEAIAELIDAALLEDPTFADRYRRLEARLRALDGELPPERAHFEGLAGRGRSEPGPDGHNDPRGGQAPTH